MLAFELVVSLIFFALSIAVAVMSKLLPTGLAPVFWVSAGAFPFILSIILALVEGFRAAIGEYDLERDEALACKAALHLVGF